MLDDESHILKWQQMPVVLIQLFLGKKHVLYTDIFYTCPNLASHLLDHKTHLCETVRTCRRYFSKNIFSVALEKGKSAFCKAKDKSVIICKFLPHKDKALKKQKTVDIFTSRHQPAEVNTTKKIEIGITFTNRSLWRKLIPIWEVLTVYTNNYIHLIYYESRANGIKSWIV